MNPTLWDIPRPGRIWTFYIGALVLLPSAVHAMIGAWDPVRLSWIDPALAPAMNALRFLGLSCATPGLTGSLSPQFYTNQVGFCAWGVILSTVVTLVQIFRGSITPANPEASIMRLVKMKGYSPKKAKRELNGKLLTMLLPVIVLMTVLFLNGIYGWSPFHIQSADWLILIIFSVGMIYLSGALVLPLYFVVASWVLYDIRNH